MINPQNPVIRECENEGPGSVVREWDGWTIVLHQIDPDLGIIMTADGALA